MFNYIQLQWILSLSKIWAVCAKKVFEKCLEWTLGSPFIFFLFRLFSFLFMVNGVVIFISIRFLVRLNGLFIILNYEIKLFLFGLSTLYILNSCNTLRRTTLKFRKLLRFLISSHVPEILIIIWVLQFLVIDYPLSIVKLWWTYTSIPIFFGPHIILIIF